MKLAHRTDTHTIYQKRSGRYAVKDAARRWVNGEEKAQVLLATGLITQSEPRPAPPAEEASGAQAHPEGEAEGANATEA